MHKFGCRSSPSVFSVRSPASLACAASCPWAYGTFPEQALSAEGGCGRLPPGKRSPSGTCGPRTTPFPQDRDAGRNAALQDKRHSGKNAGEKPLSAIGGLKMNQAPSSGAGFISEGTNKADVGHMSLPGNIHVIPQAHIDLIWYWSPAEAERMVLATFRAHADLLEANPSYTYAQSQAWAYDLVRREDPELFARIQRLVQSGRWELVGGEWVEADTAIPGPEARIRQYLYGQSFFAQHFSRRSEVAWCPDVFTQLVGSLPQILRQAGMSYLVHKRPRERYGRLPITPYLWRGQDGTEILTLRTNNKGRGLPLLSEGSAVPAGTSEVEAVAAAHAAIGLYELWGPLGVGDIGGVNNYSLPKTQASVAFSTPSRYFAAVSALERSRLPVVEGSLPVETVGCLTTWADVKGLNRAAENALQQVEYLQAICRALGRHAAVDEVHQLWREVLFMQFHDSVCGCGNEAIHTLVEQTYRHTLAQAATWRRRLARRVAEAVSWDGDRGVPVVVFNPIGHTHTCMVEARIDVPAALLDQVPTTDQAAEWCEIDCRSYRPEIGLEAVDDAGNTVPVLMTRYARMQQKQVATVRFLAQELPPFGYKTYALRKAVVDSSEATAQSAATRAVSLTSQGSEVRIQTGKLTLVFDSERGGISELRRTDELACRYAAPHMPLGTLRIHHTGAYPIDYGQELRAWHTGFTGEVETVIPIGYRIHAYSGGRVAIACEYSYGQSRFRQEFLFEPGSEQVEVTLSGDWQEVEKYLKVHFGCADFAGSTAFADMPYGFVPALPSGQEHPMQYLCGVETAGNVLGVLNTGRYGCMWREEDGLSVSVIRCATHPARISDRGAFSFTYSLTLLPQAPGWQRRLQVAALAANVAPFAYAPEFTARVLPAQWAFLAQEPSHLLATCLKPQQAGDKLVLRLYNPSDQATTDRLRIAQKAAVTAATCLEEATTAPSIQELMEQVMRPHQLATFLIAPASPQERA
jgi:alpha-mannosidase